MDIYKIREKLTNHIHELSLVSSGHSIAAHEVHSPDGEHPHLLGISFNVDGTIIAPVLIGFTQSDNKIKAILSPIPLDSIFARYRYVDIDNKLKSRVDVSSIINEVYSTLRNNINAIVNSED